MEKKGGNDMKKGFLVALFAFVLAWVPLQASAATNYMPTVGKTYTYKALMNDDNDKLITKKFALLADEPTAFMTEEEWQQTAEGLTGVIGSTEDEETMLITMYEPKKKIITFSLFSGTSEDYFTVKLGKVGTSIQTDYGKMRVASANKTVKIKAGTFKKCTVAKIGSGKKAINYVIAPKHGLIQISQNGKSILEAIKIK